MSKLRDLVTVAPALCGGSGIHALRWSKVLLDVFDGDVSDKNSVFNLQAGEKIEDRMAFLRCLFMMPGANWDKAAYVIDLLTLCAYSCAVHKGRTDLEDRRNLLAGELSTRESANVSVASVLSVSEASVQTAWN